MNLEKDDSTNSLENQISLIFTSAHLSQKLIQLEQEANDIEQLCLGSSHAENIFSPHIFDRGFNFGCANQDLYYSNRLAQDLIKRLPRLKKIFLIYSIFSPTWDLTLSRRQCIHARAFRDICGINPHWCKTKTKRKLEKGCFRELYNKYMSSGFISYMPIPKAPIGIGSEKRAHSHLRWSERKNVNPFMLKYLESFLRTYAKEYDIIIACAPARSDYIKHLGSIDLLFEKTRKISEVNGAKFYNFLGDTSFKDDMFLDWDHIDPSSNGPAEFKQRLSKHDLA